MTSPAVSDLCLLPCPDLGLGPLKAPKDAEEGGRAASGSARKGRRQHSSPQNALLDCSLCGKVFSSASSLSKHYLTHSQERKHVCKVCSKAFKRQDHLYVGVWSPTGSSGGGGSGAPGSLPSSPRSPCPAHYWGVPPPCPAGGRLLCLATDCLLTLPVLWDRAGTGLDGSLFRAPKFTPVRKWLP